jgi:NAD+ synthase
MLQQEAIMQNFDVKTVTENAIQWIKDWFEQNGKGCNAIVGISGGKDSSIVAALCVKALGKERVIGVLMPNGEQSDIDCSKQLVAHLGIPFHVCNIKKAVDGVLESLQTSGVEISRQTIVNLPPRIRMSTLYALSQSNNGRVANTCNLSEDWVGYSTRYGDAAGDFSPLGKLTVQEVKEIGKYLDLPINLVEKVPSDGLTDKTDEDNLGFTYAALDKYIRTGVCEDETVKAKIDRLHTLNEFKLKPIPCFEYLSE